MAMVVPSRPENMSGFNPLELDDVHTPPSDFYHHTTYLASATSGMFSFPQTGPADLMGSWDAAVEGAQNFQDFSDHGSVHQDSEDYSLSYGPIAAKQEGPGSPNEFQTKWAMSSIPEASVLSAEPMQRVSSKSSSRSRKQKHRALRASSKKSPSAAAVPQLASFDITGNALGPLTATGLPDMTQYHLMQDQEGLSMSPVQYSMLTGLPTDDFSTFVGMGSTLSHVDPSQVHFLEPSLGGNSPTSSSSSSSGHSRRSSPEHEDTWSPRVTSPTETHDSLSPIFEGQSPRDTRKFATHMMPEDFNEMYMNQQAMDDLSLPAAFPLRRQNSDGEARDHPLYKAAVPRADGLYHCPWEGESCCSHKPEKLKCNYDKFVDSHLKPYRCKVESCENTRFSSTACLLRHEREAHAMHGHGDKPYHCTYEGCDRAIIGNGFPRQWNLRDHMRRVHHDHSPALANPGTAPEVPAASSKSATKGRASKKKKETSDRKKSTSDSSHKTVDPSVKLRRDWNTQRDALSALVSSVRQPDAASYQALQELQSHTASLLKIHGELSQGRSRHQSG